MSNKIICAVFLCLMVHIQMDTAAQSLAINDDGTAADSSAILDVKSNSKGMLLPRTSTSSRLSIPNPANGLIIYDTTSNTFWCFDGAGWNELITGKTGWALNGNAASDPALHFIGTTDDLPLRFRLNDIWAGEFNSDLKNYFIGDSTGIATTGIKNIGIGSKILVNNTSGSWNTAVGTEALYSNKTGNYNAAFGFSSLDSNTTGFENTAIGTQALKMNTTGYYNCATGVNALYFNINGNTNTANGAYSLYRNTTGFNNTAMGFQSLFRNTSGYQNTAIGSYALYYAKSGVRNTTVGSESLLSDSLGNDNTAMGVYALASNTNANFNVAFGNYALSNHRKNDYNTAIGANALILDTSGISNTAIGYGSMTENRNGSQNTAVGQGAMYFNRASNNTAVGHGALTNITTGTQNIAIGSASGTHPAAPAVFNTVSIGNQGYLNAFQNQAFIGNLSTGWIGGQVNWATFSDSRIKKDVTEDVQGLAFITRLRPVTYYKSFAAMTALTGNKETEDYPGKYDGEKIKYSGFIAQEVETAALQSNYKFSGLHTPKGNLDLYSLSYAEFVVPLVKAVQEQQASIMDLQKLIEDQKNKLEALEKKLATIELKQ